MPGKGLQGVASERAVQRDYYAQTAVHYDEMRAAEHEAEHSVVIIHSRVSTAVFRPHCSGRGMRNREKRSRI